MKLSLSLLSMLLCLTLAATAAEYKIGVYINGATSPSLYFGRAAAKSEFPAPPFSGMFGVKDVYLLSQDASPADWFDRLSEQLLTKDGAWGIAVNSNAKLEFKAASGSIPANAWISYNDPKKGTFQTVELTEGTAVNFKAGTIVNISVGAEPTDLTIKDDTSDSTNVFVAKDEEKKYVAVSNVAVSGTTITVEFVAGIAKIYYDGEAGAEENADWIFSIKGATAYSWNSDRTVLTVTKAATRSDAEITMTANKPSASPVSATLTDSSNAHATLNWIIQKFGTMDVDGDGEITGDDAMYLYWFVSAGCPGDEDDWFTPDDLVAFTEGVGNPTAALANMRASIDDFNFDEDDQGVTGDDVMYLYWFISAGCPGAEDDWFTPDDLTAFTEGIGDPAKALENLREMKE